MQLKHALKKTACLFVPVFPYEKNWMLSFPPASMAMKCAKEKLLGLSCSKKEV